MVRRLTDETRILNERLRAARANARLADRRIAELEAQPLERLGSQAGGRETLAHAAAHEK
ncbi:hypothetical protein ACQP2T_30345 [Nonomuraea sp. CA-143628]|uniref:hypothetical protein n=1 Tax=Nonomuraea sp. CA-143628 TaxID=3239997 RepID=UPI003D8DBB6B